MRTLFTSVSSFLNSGELSDQQLLERRWQAFQNLLEKEQSCSTPAWLRRYITRIPRLYDIQAKLLPEQTSNSLRGEFILKNNATEFEDVVDFEIIVSTDYNHVLHRPSHERSCVVIMPHWKFPKDINDYPGSQSLIDFLKEEAEERVGFEASLKLAGFDF